MFGQKESYQETRKKIEKQKIIQTKKHWFSQNLFLLMWNLGYIFVTSYNECGSVNNTSSYNPGCSKSGVGVTWLGFIYKHK